MGRGLSSCREVTDTYCEGSKSRGVAEGSHLAETLDQIEQRESAGSSAGHFLVAAFLLLVPMRMAAEGLSASAAVDAVLSRNLHGLELDARCVEIAVFALALAAWRFPDENGDLDAVGGALRAMYLPWLEESARRLQEAVKVTGGLSSITSDSITSGTCTVFVDGLRYDVAVQLQERLSAFGDAQLSACWTSLPSVTASGKAWCSPVAQYIGGSADDVDFEPRVLADGKSLSGHNFRKLLSEHGVQALEKHETGDPQGKAWTEAGDLDHYGHEHGVRLARDLDGQLGQVIERISELLEAGWKHIRVVTDHGWLLMPGGLPKTELAKHQTETRWGRCAVLKDSAHGTPLTFGWDWCKDVQVAYAPGVSNFIAGAEYAHGGISFQESLVPVLQLNSAGAAGVEPAVRIQSVTWKGLRCSVVVEGSSAGQQVDIRTKAALASTSLVASVKTLEGSKANLAIADDESMGTAAIVVVLSDDGEVLQKQATTVGEQ